MKDELISREEAMNCCFKPQVRPNAEIFNALKMAIRSEISAVPSVPAIPIDKLCEWLTETDMPLANACPLIEKHHVCIQCDFFQRPIKECWKEILLKLMEEQNAAD